LTQDMAFDAGTSIFGCAVFALLYTYVVYPIVLLTLAEGRRGAE